MKITDADKINEYYEALVERNEDYQGVFFAGVKTTSIFCISTCRARKPKKENVVFFSDFKDALIEGFRPCRICHPTENSQEAPDEIKDAVRLITDNPKQKYNDYEMKTLGFSPSFLRRWFQDNYGITFQSFQRMYRINTAFEELQKGKNVTDTAFDSGYESLSGFGYTYKKLFGNSPSKSDGKNIILIHRLTTPIGPMFTCATDEGICLLEFTNRRALETEFRDIQKKLNAVIIAGVNNHIKQLEKELKEYFGGNRKQFTVSLVTPGTEFQQIVWTSLKKIPYGETTSYLKQSISIGREKAVRAVATANGNNRVAIIIPCHRVIGSDGSLTGYAGGLERKQWLLDFEKSNLYQ